MHYTLSCSMSGYGPPSFSGYGAPQILEIIFFDPKGRRAFLRIVSTEGRGAYIGLIQNLKNLNDLQARGHASAASRGGLEQLASPAPLSSNPDPETRDPKPGSRIPKPETRIPNPEILTDTVNISL